MCGKCLDWTKGGIWRVFCCCCLCLCLSLSCLLINVLKMFRLDQKQLFTDYWRNLKPKQTFDPVPHYYPPSQWRPISGNGDKENRETLTSLCFHPVNSRLTFKNYMKRINSLQIPSQISLYDIFIHFRTCDFWNAFGWLDSGRRKKHKCYGHNCVLVFPVLAAFSCVYFDYLKVIFWPAES